MIDGVGPSILSLCLVKVGAQAPGEVIRVGDVAGREPQQPAGADGTALLAAAADDDDVQRGAWMDRRADGAGLPAVRERQAQLWHGPLLDSTQGEGEKG